MTRTVYLIVYNSPLFPAHWALWIPQVDEPTIGKRIHASGDAANGFEVCFERNYDIAGTGRRHQLLPLAEVSEEHVVDVKGEGTPSQDQAAHDRLEEVALSVPAPGPSLVSAAAKGQRQRVPIQNCQTWLRDVVASLVQHGVMSQESLDAVDKAPKN